MAKELSILLVAKDLASKTIGKVGKNIGALDGAAARASRGVKVLGASLAAAGAAGAVFLAANIRTGIDNLVILEDATAAVTGSIQQMGLAGKVAAADVVRWASDIEAATGAAFDDKDIVAATNTLIRFGKVTPGNLEPAMVVMTDLATKTGDVDSAATLLAKALADPEKAAGKLARSGVILTKAEQDQIKVFMKAGQAAKAQDLILRSLSATTKDAALNSQGPYKRSMKELGEAVEDAQMALATGFLPVIQDVANLLKNELVKPSTIAGIREFGKGLAGGLRSLIEMARGLPWGAIGDSLRIGGEAAKTILGAFNAMPEWLKVAAVTGWGLNKLTGGAISGIVGSLASGLVKGVLGMNAGVVNINAGVVNGAGGGLPMAGKGGGALGKVGAIATGVMKVAVVGMAAGVAVALGQELANQSVQIREQAGGVREQANTFGKSAGEKDLANAIRNIDEQLANPFNDLALQLTNPLNGARDQLIATRLQLRTDLQTLKIATAAGDERVASRITSLNSAISGAAAKTAAASYATVAAIRNGFNVTVPVYVTSTVSVRNQRVATAVSARYGGSNRIYEP